MATNTDPATGGCFFVFVRLHNEIADTEDSAAVPVKLTRNTGLTNTDTLVPGRDPEFNQLRGDLQFEDFGQPVSLSIKVDPDGNTPESNEDNNSDDFEINVPTADGINVTCPITPTPSPSPTGAGQ